MSDSIDLPSGTVTSLFVDLVGSTGLLATLKGDYQRLLDDYHRLLSEAASEHSGAIVDRAGDGLFLSFGRATQALQAAIEAQRRMSRHTWPQGADVQARMGLHTGEPLLAASGYVGMDLHRAARIAASGHGGQILLSQTTVDLVSSDLPPDVVLVDLGEHQLRDVERGERIYQVAARGLQTTFPLLQVSFALRFRLLGPLAVTRGGQPIPLGGPKQRLVLAHLLIRPNQVVSADLLIDEIWGEEPPEAARASLHSYVSHLKKALGGERLLSRPPGYLLNAAEEEIDAARFEALTGQARRRLESDPAGAARALRDALALWQGEPLADLAHELSLQGEIERLSELRLVAVEDRLSAELALGRHDELVAELERLVARQPLRERLAGQLMLALYRSGRQAQALAAYHRLRTALDEQLGLEPSPAIEQLQRQILNHDPVLELGGKPLRGYRLVEQLGSSPLGTIHGAFEPQTERDVAIKVLAASVANDANFVLRFDAEARRIARLEHPHIVPLYDWWREPDAAYLVMRLLRGGSLAERLARGQVGSATALRWAEQIGGALTAAHRQGLMHGDIRPGNVLIDTEDNAYLSDFAVGYDPVAHGQQQTDATRRYLAPERREGEPPSVAADIYGLGVLLSELFLSASEGRDGVSLRPALERATAESATDRFTTVADLLAAVRRALLPATSTETALDKPAPTRNPYKGLRAFDEADAADFFGREELVRRLVERMAEKQARRGLLAVVGPSGSGKSSLISAGLVPALRAGALPGSEGWFIATLTPGDRPFDALEQALLSVAVGEPGVLTELLQGGDGLLRASEQILPPGGQLVLFIDQFEELFTLVADDHLRQRFLGTLTRAAASAGSGLRLLITLRADFYDRPLRHDQFGRLLAAGTEAVPPLTPEELERVISGPAESAGLALDAGLVARMVAEVSEQPGGLALLQYTLADLWERRDGRHISLRAYEASGGIAGAVGRRAEQLLRSLDAEGRELARQLFLRLVELGEGTPDTARRVRLGELQALAADRSLLNSVIDAFARYRLLLFDRDPESRQPTVELAHEALLQAWPRLQQWIDEARDDMRQQRRLAAFAGQWLEANRDPSFLLSGSRLAQTEQWAANTRVLLVPAERDYLAAGTAEEQRRRTHEADLERRAVNRLRALVVVLGLGALLAGALSVFAFAQSERAAREARVATARELATSALANLEVDPERSILLALEAIEATRAADGTVLREAEEALHQATIASRVVLTVPDEGGFLAWADNPTLDSVFVTQGPVNRGLVNVRDARTGDLVVPSWRAHASDMTGVAFSPDGSSLATGGDDGYLRVWDPATQQELFSWPGPQGRVRGPSFSPDGTLLAAAWELEGIVRVFRIATREIVLELNQIPGEAATEPMERPWKTSFSPDGRRLAVVAAGTIFVLDLDTHRALFSLGEQQGDPQDVKWSPDGRWIASSSFAGSVVAWDGDNGERRFTLATDLGRAQDVSWSPDSTHLVAAGAQRATVWEVTDDEARERFSLASHDMRSGVRGVAFSPDGERVMTSDDFALAVKVWDIGLSGDAEWMNLPAASFEWAGMTVLSDGRLAAATGGGSIGIWDPAGRLLLDISMHEGDVMGIEASSDGELIASFASEGNEPGVKVWSAANGQLVHPPLRPDSYIGGVAWSPDGQLLAIGSWREPWIDIIDRAGRVVEVLELEDGYKVADLSSNETGLLAASVWPDDELDPRPRQVLVWRWDDFEHVRTIETFPDWLAIDPAGERLATNHFEGHMEIHGLTADEATIVVGHAGRINSLTFSPDGARIATGGDDGTVRLWDAGSGVPELALRGHTARVQKVRFSPDGARLYSNSSDGTVRVWALALDDLISIARQKLTRTLTDEECRDYLRVEACPRPD